jgi:hypothetical protein
MLVPPAKRSPKAILVRFVLALALLIAPWPGLGRAFTGTVGAIATALADPLTASTNVTFLLRSPKDDEALNDWHGVISVRQDFPDGPVDHAGAIDLRRAGYLQLATFGALAVAWPPKGRWLALLAACVSLGLVATVIVLPILDFLSPLGAVHLGACSAALVSLGSRTLVGAPSMAYAVPGLAWFAVMGPRWPLRGRGASNRRRTSSRTSASLRPIVEKEGIRDE